MTNNLIFLAFAGHFECLQWKHIEERLVFIYCENNTFFAIYIVCICRFCILLSINDKYESNIVWFDIEHGSNSHLLPQNECSTHLLPGKMLGTVYKFKVFDAIFIIHSLLHRYGEMMACC